MHVRLRDEYLILDGGLGTTLEDLHDIKFSQQTPLWSSDLLISDPKTLQKVQESFLAAGADIILTPTYQASHLGFRKTRHGISDKQVEEYFQSAIDISRKACGSSRLVALSLGAYGATLQPSQEYSGEYGDLDQRSLVIFHQERISAFDLSGVDIVAFETIPRLDEIRAVKQVVDGTKPYWISCVFPTDNKLPDGSTIKDVVESMMTDPRPWAIGMNCTKIERVEILVVEFERASEELAVKLPRLVLYPDGTNGEWYDTATQKWVGQTNSDELWHQKLYDITTGVQDRGMWEGIVAGGCCKTTPQHINDLHLLRSRQRNK